MWPARWRLASLWISQTARVLANCVLRIFVVLQLIVEHWQPEEAWQLATALLMLPAVAFAPLNGGLSNSLPKPLALVGSAAYCFAVVGVFALLHGPWLACWALVAVGAAVYSPTRYALLPAASEDARIPLTRINGWIEAAVFVAIVAGFVLGAELHADSWNGWETAVIVAAGLNLLGLVAALPVRFASDVRRPESAAQALVGFFRDCRRVWQQPAARGSLLALAGLRALITAIMGAVIGLALGDVQGTLGDVLTVWLPLGGCVLGGVALGCILAGWQRHPRRVLGLVPLGATGLALGLALMAMVQVPASWLCVFLGSMAGLIQVPLAATYQDALPADARGNGMAVRGLADAVAVAVAAMLSYGLTRADMSAALQLWLFAGAGLLAALVSWRVLLCQTLELVVEMAIWPMYRVRAVGPGVETFPRRGPLLVIGNHSAWLDPVWAAKVLPRQLIPMMTSVFYDLPILRTLMRLAGAIRVQASGFRREAPEIEQAVAALDRGDCVIVFPEGAMRRREDQPLRHFGQGIALILKERPQTPVVICWIEGGWGSYFSYCNGPPTKNKRMDFRRRIEIAVESPRVLDPALIADPRALRRHLMEACLNARHHLGLAPLTLDALAAEPPEEEPVPG